MEAKQERYVKGWDRAFARQDAERAVELAAQRRLEAAAERGAARQVATTAADGLLSVPQVASLLAMSEDFVRDHAGELGGCRVGSRLRFRRASVDAWIDAQRHDEPPDAPSRRPGPRRTQAGVELLPLPGRRDTD
jgi:excisionase family DNA binding protein